jgi:hypothetical protein
MRAGREGEAEAAAAARQSGERGLDGLRSGGVTVLFGLP